MKLKLNLRDGFEAMGIIFGIVLGIATFLGILFLPWLVAAFFAANPNAGGWVIAQAAWFFVCLFMLFAVRVGGDR